jgi:hypothetical protein
MVKRVSEIKAMSILCMLRDVCSSNLWFMSPLAFQSTTRRELCNGGNSADDCVK